LPGAVSFLAMIATKGECLEEFVKACGGAQKSGGHEQTRTAGCPRFEATDRFLSH
jgi:hypothetical protein